MPRRTKYTVRKRDDRPNGPYYVFWTEAGRQRKRSLGLFDPDLARAKENQLNLEDEQRRVFGHSEAEANMTFAYAAYQFLESSEDDAQRNARSRFIQKPIEFLGDYSVRKLTEDIINTASRKAYPVAAPATRRRQFNGPINSVLNFAASGGRNWCAKPNMKLPDAGNSRTEYLLPEEADKIIRSASPHLRHIIELGLCGCRASEVATLIWADTNLTLASAELRTTKNNRDRRFDLSPRAVAALANVELKEGAVAKTPQNLPYAIKKHTGGTFNDGLKAACKRAGVKIVTFHVLRHSWATWFYDQTKDLLRLKALGGWSSLTMVERYAHVAPPGIGGQALDYGWDFLPQNHPIYAPTPREALK